MTGAQAGLLWPCATMATCVASISSAIQLELMVWKSCKVLLKQRRHLLSLCQLEDIIETSFESTLRQDIARQVSMSAMCHRCHLRQRKADQFRLPGAGQALLPEAGQGRQGEAAGHPQLPEVRDLQVLSAGRHLHILQALQHRPAIVDQGLLREKCR